MDCPLRSLVTIALASRLRRDCASAATVACPVGPHAAEKREEQGGRKMEEVGSSALRCEKYEILI
jgi:hypothetical protein